MNKITKNTIISFLLFEVREALFMFCDIEATLRLL